MAFPGESSLSLLHCNRNPHLLCPIKHRELHISFFPGALWYFRWTEQSIDKSKNYFTCFISFIREKRKKKTKPHPLSPCTFRQFRKSRWVMEQQFMVMLSFNDIAPDFFSRTELCWRWPQDLSSERAQMMRFLFWDGSVCGVLPQGKEAWPQQTDIL